MDVNPMDLGLGPSDLDHLQLHFDPVVTSSRGSSLMSTLSPSHENAFDQSSVSVSHLLTEFTTEDVNFPKEMSLMQSPTLDLPDTFPDSGSIFSHEGNDITFSTSIANSSNQPWSNLNNLSKTCDSFTSITVPMASDGVTLAQCSDRPPIFTGLSNSISKSSLETTSSSMHMDLSTALDHVSDLNKSATFLNQVSNLSAAQLIPTQRLLLFLHKETGKQYLIPESQLLSNSGTLKFVEVSSCSNLSSSAADVRLSDVPVVELGPSVIDVNQFLNIPVKQTSENEQLPATLVSPPENKDNVFPELFPLQERSFLMQKSPTYSVTSEASNPKILSQQISQEGCVRKDVNFKLSVVSSDNENSLHTDIADEFVDKPGNYISCSINSPEHSTHNGQRVLCTQDEETIEKTEQRIANIVPDSMKDFVRDIFEDEDALEREYIQHIMDDTGPGSTHLADGITNSTAPVKFSIRNDELNPMLLSTVTTYGDTTLLTEQNAITNITVQIDDKQIIVVDGVKKWQCNQCPKTYTNKGNLVSHVLQHCGIKPYMCSLCGKLFTQLAHLYTHKLTHNGLKAHVCNICGKEFTQHCHLKRHSAIHLEYKPHSCSICQKGFAFPSDLKSHQEKHMLGKNICSDCDQGFETSKDLKLHKQNTHREVVDLRCKDCGKVFIYPSQLKEHALRHEGERPFICSECGMDFYKEHHLRAHALIHTGAKPWECEVCGRKFNQKANMHRHMLIHQEDKKYKCEICDRTFSQPQILKSHMLIHKGEKPFKCQECGKEFSRQHNLKGHAALHAGDKKYHCYCGLSFTLKGNLNRHQKVKHGTKATSSVLSDETAAQILNEMASKRMCNDLSLTPSSPPETEQSVEVTASDQYEQSNHKKKRKSAPPRKAVSATHTEPIEAVATSSLQSEEQVIEVQYEGSTVTILSNIHGSTRRKSRSVVKNQAKLSQATDACETEDEVEMEWQGNTDC